MKHDIRRMALAAVIPLFLLFILYILKFLETGMDWNFTRLGVYPLEQRGVQYLHIVGKGPFTGIVKVYFPQAIIRKSHGSPDAMYRKVIIIKSQISKAGEQCIQQKSTEDKGEYSRNNSP